MKEIIEALKRWNKVFSPEWGLVSIILYDDTSGHVKGEEDNAIFHFHRIEDFLNANPEDVISSVDEDESLEDG